MGFRQFLSSCWRRWLLPLLGSMTIVLVLFQLSGCQPISLRSQAAQGNQLVLSTLTDPKTFNYANNQSFPNIFLFAYEGLTSVLRLGLVGWG